MNYHPSIMLSRKIFSACAAAVIASFALACSAAPPSDAVPLKIDAAPILDGRLDEPFWQTARPLGAFQLLGRADRPAADDTAVKLAYDNAWLYLGVRCRNPLQKLILAPKVKNHDSAVHTDESVELFITADEQGKNYYHFMLSCFNVRAEQRLLNGAPERETWNLPWRSATAADEQGWTAEIALPLYVLLEYGDLDRIRMNIGRNRRCPVMDANNVITHETMEHSVWRPVQRSFHEPAAFGALAPLQPEKLAVPFLVWLENVEIQPYFIKDGTNYYQADITLKGANPTRGEAELEITDRPVGGGATRTVRKRVAVNHTTPLAVSVAVPAPAPAERSITVTVRDGAGGEIMQSITVENPACLKVMAAYLDRNYYTAEAEAVAVAEIAMAGEMLSGMTVAVELGGKIAGSAPAARETMVRFPLEQLADGNHPVKIILQSKAGGPFCEIAAELVKRAPRPGREVKLDQINRIVLKDGRPFFPFGPVVSSSNPEHEADFKKIAAAGCNAFCEFSWATKDAAAYLPATKRYGLHLVARLENGWPSFKDAGLKMPAQLLSAEEAVQITSDTRGSDLEMRGHLMRSKAPVPAKNAVYAEYVGQCLPATERMVASVKDADNFLAYNSLDEPFASQLLDMTKSMDAIYRLAQRADGYHPVMLNYSSYIPEGDEYVTGCDILCTDPYWTPGGAAQWGVRRTPNFVSKIVAWTDRRAEKFRKAVWIIPLGSTWNGVIRSKRVLSGPEQHCQNFLAVIHGAKGLFWNVYPMPDVCWEILKESMAMIKVIGPMAVQPKVAQQIAYLGASAPDQACQAAAFNPDKDEFPDVQGRIFRDPQGGLVLLAANSRYYPVTAAFTVAGLGGHVEPLFGRAALPVKDGVFSEELEPFAVRAYRLGTALQEPVAATIAVWRPAEIPPPETAWPDNARMGRKNVLPNPSFEEETAKGMADYYFGDPGTVTLIADAEAAKFGRKCLRLVNTNEQYYARVGWNCCPQHDGETPYVWSFWAKGAQGGERLWLRGPSEGGKPWINADGGVMRFTLTSAWKRYNLPMTIPARVATRQQMEVRLWCVGTAWLDGLQLEKGYAATEFEE